MSVNHFYKQYVNIYIYIYIYIYRHRLIHLNIFGRVKNTEFAKKNVTLILKRLIWLEQYMIDFN